MYRFLKNTRMRLDIFHAKWSPKVTAVTVSNLETSTKKMQ
jgi:hypothetical protein